MIYSTLETRHPASRVSLSLSLSFSLYLSPRLSYVLFISLPLASLFPKLFLSLFFPSSSVRYDSNVNQLPTYLEKHDGKREKEKERETRRKKNEWVRKVERGGREKRVGMRQNTRILTHRCHLLTNHIPSFGLPACLWLSWKRLWLPSGRLSLGRRSKRRYACPTYVRFIPTLEPRLVALFCLSSSNLPFLFFFFFFFFLFNSFLVERQHLTRPSLYISTFFLILAGTSFAK